MSEQAIDKKNGPEGSFDRVIQLISECVVIKAQLQQFMSDLDGEKQKSRAVTLKMNEIVQGLQNVQKGVDIQKILGLVLKDSEGLYEVLHSSRLGPVIVSMDEAVARFSKVMGDLQHELVTMDLGASAISIMQVLLVKIDGEIYAIPIEAVLEIFKVKKNDIHSVDGNDTVSLRGHALGVVNVGQVLGMPNAKTKDLVDRKVVVITDSAQQIGVIVDELLGEESVVFKDLPVQLRGMKGLRGASILGDGRVGLIIDSAMLISMAGGKE